MPGLDDIQFATDAELVTYESEIVAQAEARGLSLDAYRSRALSRLKQEAGLDGIDPADIVDATSPAGLALRDWATHLTLYYYYRDLSSGRDNSVLTAKAQMAREDAETAESVVKHLGWPTSSTGATEPAADVDVLPRLVRVRL